MRIKIYRGAQEIGGTCIELQEEGKRLLIDVGAPLNDPNPGISYLNQNFDAILISHPHQDHYGLIHHLNNRTPIYISELSLNLINASRIFTGKAELKKDFHFFSPWKSISIAGTPFRFTPYLMDHSSPDAFAFLIEVNGKRLLYSGDFRSTGYKGKLFGNMVKSPPAAINVLFLEGTMIKRENKRFPSEASVQQRFEEIISQQNNITFIVSSSQNVDRIVSAYKACRHCKKNLVVDFYTAWILKQVGKVSTAISNLVYPEIKVLSKGKIAAGQYDKMKSSEIDFSKFIKETYERGTLNITDLIQQPAKYVVFGRMSFFDLIHKFDKKNLNVIYSQWDGYLDEARMNKLPYGAAEIDGLRNDPEVNFSLVHTSGHATLPILQELAESLKPDIVIPIHTEFPNKFTKYFDNVSILKDREILNL